MTIHELLTIASNEETLFYFQCKDQPGPHVCKTCALSLCAISRIQEEKTFLPKVGTESSPSPSSQTRKEQHRSAKFTLQKGRELEREKGRKKERER